MALASLESDGSRTTGRATFLMPVHKFPALISLQMIDSLSLILAFFLSPQRSPSSQWCHALVVFDFPDREGVACASALG